MNSASNVCVVLAAWLIIIGIKILGVTALRTGDSLIAKCGDVPIAKTPRSRCKLLRVSFNEFMFLFVTPQVLEW